jgi:hypothetical protein
MAARVTVSDRNHRASARLVKDSTAASSSMLEDWTSTMGVSFTGGITGYQDAQGLGRKHRECIPHLSR